MPGQVGAEQAIAGGEGESDLAQASFGHVAQTAANRLADQHRADQHHRADRDTEQSADVAPGVKPERVQDKGASRHDVCESESIGDEPAIEQLTDGTHLGGEFGGVGDDDQRHLVVSIQFHQQVAQRLGGGVVERAGRFIGEDEA